MCCINRFTSLCKSLFNLLEFLAEAFRCHVHHFQCLTVPGKASAKNSSKLNKFLHSEVNLLIQLIIVQDQDGQNNNSSWVFCPPPRRVIALLPLAKGAHFENPDKPNFLIGFLQEDFLIFFKPLSGLHKCFCIYFQCLVDAIELVVIMIIFMAIGSEFPDLLSMEPWAVTEKALS